MHCSLNAIWDWLARRQTNLLLERKKIELQEGSQRFTSQKFFFFWHTCVCSCSSFFCGSRDGCLRRKRTPPSGASGPATSSPRPPCPPGSARSPDSADLGRRHFPFRCLLHLETTISSSASQKTHDWMSPPQKQRTFFVHVVRDPAERADCLQNSQRCQCVFCNDYCRAD